MNHSLRKVFMIFGLTLSFMLAPLGQAYAVSQELERLEELLSDSPLEGLSTVDQRQIDNFLSRYRESERRVDSCPMDSTEHIEILNKIETIRALFRDNCLDHDQERLSEILDSARSIQDSLDDLRKSANGDEVDDDTTGSLGQLMDGDDVNIGGVTVSGEQIASVFDNINNIFLNGQCELDRGTFLGQTADIIQTFAQMGLLVPNQNGLVVSAGGMALSSILRAIDNIFTSRFDFEKIQDRQTFVKLNCAFFDLRNDIRETGMLDVPTQTHRDDLELVGEHNRTLRAAMGHINSRAGAIERAIRAYRAAELEGSFSFLESIEKEVKELFDMVAKPLDSDPLVPQDTQKMRLIQALGMRSELLHAQVREYIERGFSSFEMMDQLFLKELEAFHYSMDPGRLNELMSLTPSEFDQKHRSQLYFHLERAKEDIEKNRTDVNNRWNNDTPVLDQTIGQVESRLASQKSSLQAQVQSRLDSLNIVKKRLEHVLNHDEYRASDDSTENLVYILQQYDDITAQIYGKWGYKFVDYTTFSADQENREFQRKFESFADNHLVRTDQRSVGLRTLSNDEIGELEKIYACQDALPFRRSWKLADGLIRQSYDFLMTNKELFHGDVPRGFLGFRRDFERLQNHYRSSFFAQRILNGDDVSENDIDSYIEKRYTIRRRKFAGKVMLELKDTRPQAGLIQEVIENYSCHDVLMP